MKLGIMPVLAVLLIATAHAQNSSITLETDDSSYEEGDTIVLFGRVDTIIGTTPITLQLLREDNSLVDVAQIIVAQDGTYSHTIIAEGPLWLKQGTYIARMTYGETSVQTEFSYTPKSGIAIATEIFEVNAGSHGTFDVEYKIQKGTVSDMVIDAENFALIVQIEAVDEGSILVDLPRKFIDAKSQGGQDVEFIVLIDDVVVSYDETQLNFATRALSLDFEQGDSRIMIIGTHVLPEFQIMMLVLTAGILGVILASYKSRLL